METIKILGNRYFFNKNINISLDNNFDLSKVDDIDLFSKEALQKSINPIIDGELEKFYPKDLINKQSDFIIDNEISYFNLFTYNEIVTNVSVFRNSFWILDYFDTFEKNKQTLIYRQFYKPNIFKFNDATIRLTYYNNNKLNGLEYENLYIPIKFLNLIEDKIYLRYRFFYSKTGEIFNFRIDNPDNIFDDLSTHLTIKVDKLEKKWYIDTVNTTTTFVNYRNPFIDEDTENNGIIDIDDNNEKGTFINTEGRYQDGGNVNTETC